MPSGARLMQQGFEVRLDTALTSKMLLAVRID